MMLYKKIKTKNIEAAAVLDSLKTNKIVHLSAPTCDRDEYYQNLLANLGKVIPMEEDLVSGNKTGDLWTDIRYDSNIANSFRHSNTAQPLHTDGSYEANAPDISVLYCLTPAVLGGATTFIDNRTLINIIKKLAPRKLKSLSSLPLTFSKGDDKKITTVLSDKNLNWNSFRVSSEEQCGKEFINWFTRFLEHLVAWDVPKKIYLNSGEALLFHDKLLLHGRDAFTGNRWLRKGGFQWLTNL